MTVFLLELLHEVEMILNEKPIEWFLLVYRDKEGKRGVGQWGKGGGEEAWGGVTSCWEEMGVDGRGWAGRGGKGKDEGMREEKSSKGVGMG